MIFDSAVYESQKLELLRRTASQYDSSGADPRLVTAAQALILQAGNSREPSLALPRQTGREFWLTEEKRPNATGKATGLVRVLAVRSGPDGGAIGHFVEKIVVKSDLPTDSSFWLHEALFYATVRDKLSSNELRIPKLYGLDVGETHCRIIIEHFEDCRPAADEAEFCRIAHALGALAARASRLEPSEVDWLSLRSHHVSYESLAAFEELTATLAAEIPAVTSAHDKFEQFMNEYDAIEAGRRAVQCLCHGDAHMRNLVLAANGATITLWDWSHVRKGHACDDLMFMLPQFIMRPSLWGGDLVAAMATIRESYCAGFLSTAPHAPPRLIKRSHVIGVILFFLAHSRFLLDRLKGAKNKRARFALARRVARLLNRHAAAAKSLADAATGARNNRP